MKQWFKRVTGITWLKTVITICAAACIVLRLIFPEIKIDAITVGLLVIAVLPWFSSLIESAKLPGGWEVKFRDLQKAAAAITESAPSSETITKSTPPIEPAFLSVAMRDPNLALAGLRIEIEKRVRAIALKHGIQETYSIRQTLDRLRQAGVFDYRAIGGLEQIINAGNQAAHGAHVEPSVSEWAIEYGPSVLNVLDNHLKET